MYIPINYENINIVSAFNMPSAVHSHNNLTYAFWERSLFQRACSVLELTVPDEWEGKTKDFLYYCLLRFGYVAIFNHNNFGLSFQPCNLYGFNFYYQPTNALISNPALTTSLDLKIGKDCELLKLQPDYLGTWDCISYYAEKLSTLDNAINMSLINNKFSYLIGAKNRSAAKALKKMFDLMNKGEPAVVFDMTLLNDPTDKSEPWQFLERKDLKSSYLTTDQLNDFRTLINNFDAEIGLPATNTKRERLLTEEVETNNADSTARCEVWLRTLNSSIDEVKKLFPDINLAVKLRKPTSDNDESEVTENVTQ